ncbi:hypothetical protein BDZ97DRAFT_1908037 [Flammula alnicola]|nr:hypothetical protein BDZ97DRAFT_1908037 [Flammula alnicola]
MKRAFVLLAASLTTLQVAGTSSPPVKATLRSSWPAPPFLAEILETVSLENPDAFFTYVDLLTGPDGLASPATMTPEAIHQAALEIAIDNGIIPDPGSLVTVQMNLAMHAATPKLEAFYNYYEDSHHDSRGTECGSWVDWYGEVVCDVETLAHLAGVEAIDPPKLSGTELYVFPLDSWHAHVTFATDLTFDHIFPPPADILERPPRTAILYASLTSSNFRELHTYLLTLVNRLDPHVEYVFRHLPPSNPPQARNFLSGYGVALDLKKMDYLALDDRNLNSEGTTSSGSKSESEGQEQRVDPLLPLLLAHPENTTAPDSSVALTSEELETLGAKAAQIIADSSEPLNILTQLSQNFPKYATTLARRVVVNESIAEELHNNSLRVPRGINVMWLNGLQVEAKDVHPFGLLRSLKKEKAVMQSLTSQGLQTSQVLELLTHPAIAATQKDSGALDSLFDASDRLEGGDIIVWWNDMEKDKRYARWNPSIYALLRPMFPGAMPSIKANLFNVVLILDLSQMSSLNLIAGPMTNIINRDIPLRFGLVPVAETEDGKKMAKLLYHLIKNYGRRKTLGFLAALPPHMQTDKVQWEAVRSTYDRLVEEESQEKPGALIPDLATIFDEGSEALVAVEKIDAYTERLGATLSKSAGGHAFFNGKHFSVNDDFLRHLQNELTLQMTYLQEKIYEGTLSDANKGERMSNYFYDLPTTSKRRNRYIFSSNAAGSVRILNLPEVFGKTLSVSRLRLADFESISESLYVVADLDSEAGLSLIKEALTSLTSDSKTRISFIHNPTAPSVPGSATRPPVSWLFSHLHTRELLSKATPAAILSALGLENPVTPSDSPQIPIGHESSFESLTGGVTLADIMPEEYYDFVKSSRLVVRTLQLAPGQSALVVNGRVVGPIDSGDFRVADFKALEDYEFRKRTESVVKALQEVAPESVACFILLTREINLCLAATDPSEVGLFDAPPRPRQRTYQLLESEYTPLSRALLVDPLSETAQKWSVAISLPDIFIEIHLNPGRYTDVRTLKRFYRYNLIPSLLLMKKGSFEDLPVDPIYTLAMDVPTAWLLGKLFPGDTAVEAVFDLDYMLLRACSRSKPWRSSSDGAPIDDTQVVANLGYFQFKAKPGVFQFEIRPGRAGNRKEITVTSFEGLTLYPRFSRLPGMEIADVLEEEGDESSKGIFEDLSSRVMSIFKSSKKDLSAELVPVKQQADINIFTVASGLLYEEFIPHMAAKYNFQYELVTYKWPSWLRAQTEKQRIIWAYKILFLDVLFPMDLKKVIFVDADQIVRADLKELVDLDLHGAPYGYTPMGDDNTDMEGFRFWKTGYWREFLQGKPYHIRSATLSMLSTTRTDLCAMTDILRGQYQQLSADPNSLANLDQDLPNNLQDQVPIVILLDEDWLWCETWCSKDRLHRAKTIDLCQNPLTKEPKLARARQIPEWEEYDTEIARFTRELAEEGKIHSRMATADANVLAGAGANGVASAKGVKEAESAAAAVVGSDEHTEQVIAKDSEEVTEEPTRDEL